MPLQECLPGVRALFGQLVGFSLSAVGGDSVADPDCWSPAAEPQFESARAGPWILFAAFPSRQKAQLLVAVGDVGAEPHGWRLVDEVFDVLR